MRISDYTVLSFDTYGTLIDWETGIVQSLQSLLGQMARPPSGEEVLQQFGRIESRLEDEAPDMLYSEILEIVYLELARNWGLRESVAQAEVFGRSVGDWPAFPDSADALAYLKKHFKLVTLTNCDRENYAGSAARLGHPWDLILTAEEIGSYKPSLINFDYLVREVRTEFGCEKAAILHVAQSQFHDIAPALQVGLASCWINRRAGKSSGGASLAPGEEVKPDCVFESMDELVEAHKAEQ